MMTQKYKMVVFDDDPTGIQTVHDCLLVTQWDSATLHKAFADDMPFFYILTNTRAMTPQEAEKTLRSALEAVIECNKDYGFQLICISRSDSCLRGHFPLETDVMRSTLESHGIAVWEKTPFVPAFIESGRVTIGGTHYMRDKERLIPVAETEFARDNVFGYHSSVLTEYISEKGADPERYDIVDAASYEELYKYCTKLKAMLSEWHGSIVIRSSSSLPRALSGIGEKGFLTREDLGIRDCGIGCFIVGSHVKKTTQQLQRLLEEDAVGGIALGIEDILHDGDALRVKTLKAMLSLAVQGITPVVYTAREEVRIDDVEKRQALGKTVSDFLVSLVRHLPYRAAYLVAKGGITSHDILTHGLEVKTARVMGQAINSVPCIMAEKGGESLPYIIFPGNVGNEDSLREIFQRLSQK